MGNVANEPLSRYALAFVLAGGRGSRLLELTDKRAKPAVYFGGKSRIIDFALSNAVNSGIRRIAVATQYKAHSLIRHLQMGWNFFRPERNESFDILPASQRISETNWYLGTADAVYQNIYSIGSEQPKHVLILSGDHIYKMDYGKMLDQHQDSAADITLATIQIDPEETYRFGVVDVDKDGRINGFEEKPKVTQLRYPSTLSRYQKAHPLAPSRSMSRGARSVCRAYPRARPAPCRMTPIGLCCALPKTLACNAACARRPARKK